MTIQEILNRNIVEGVKELYGVEIEKVEFQHTRKEFEGDITVVIFGMLKYVKGNPESIGTKIGEWVKEKVSEVRDFNVVKGFLNLVLEDSYYIGFLREMLKDKEFGKVRSDDKSGLMIVEYSSPNTNKPLHLGHIRNNLLGYAIANIIGASGKRIVKTQIINDRGIHICKSMIAWKKFANGETPESSGLKGDKLVGNYYVAFDKEYKKEIGELVEGGMSKEDAEREAPIYKEAQEMLRKWEAGDSETIELWKTMNGWVYKGFEVTYKNLGVDFDRYYYESNTYLLGKNIVDRGLESGVFYKKEDGSVWCDLTKDGLDEKLVLRGDGTSVYITQDLGTAVQRCEEHYKGAEGMVYTVGNEQDYHFKVLFLILNKLGYSWAKKLYHLSYGMVELPNGKMKSREGTVVDADDLIEEVTNVAEEISKELGKLEGYNEEQKKELYRIIGLGALKYFILKYDPKKTIKFDPKESIDFQGNTGPFIQYAHARIRSIMRKAEEVGASMEFSDRVEVGEKEKELIKNILLFPEVVKDAANSYNPAIIANYVYDLVREFNSFYQNVQILGEEDADKRGFRISMSKKVSEVIKYGFSLLGIEVPERM